MKARIDRAIELALAWLTESGIIASAPRGAVHAWFDPASRMHSFAYAEMAGYALTTLAYAHTQIAAEPRYLERAHDCAAWLLDEMFDDRHLGFWCRADGAGKLTHICTFDNGMILAGLYHLVQIDSRPAYVEHARAVHATLAARLTAGGTLRHRFLPDTGAYEAEQAGWSKQEGAFLGKAAVADLLWHRPLGRAAPAFAEAVLDAVVRQQQPDGRFVTDRYSGSTFLHPHCYALEGLAAGYAACGKAAYLDAVRRGVDWALTLQQPDGGIAHLVDGDRIDPRQSADINAQVLRLWSWCLQRGWMTADASRYDALIARVLAAQHTDGPREVRGGVEYGYTAANERVAHINSWSTMFTIQALDAARRRLAGDAAADPLWVI